MKSKAMPAGRQGFTLIELLVYVAVFAILLTTISLFAIAFIKSTAKSRIKKEVSLGAYSAMKTMLYEIKRANRVYTPTSIFDSHPGQLSLETNQEAPEGEEITYLDFYLDSANKLYIKREGQDSRLLISENFKVTNLEFERLASSSESVRINLTLEYDTSASEYQYSYSLSSSGSIRK